MRLTNVSRFGITFTATTPQMAGDEADRRPEVLRKPRSSSMDVRVPRRHTPRSLDFYTMRHYRRGMGRTNIELDDRLVRRGLRAFRCKSKRELVHLALTQLLKQARRREILELRGQVKWEADLEQLRRSRP